MDIKEITEYLGVPDVKDLAEFKTKFDSEFIRVSAINEDVEPVKKILGKTLGTLESGLKKIAKTNELDLDLDSEDIKSKKLSDKINLVFGKYDEKNKTVIEDLTAKAALGNDDKVKEWQTKFEKAVQKSKDYEGLLNTTKTEYEQFKLESDNRIKGVKLNIHKKDILSSGKFIPEVEQEEGQYRKKGFLNEFQEKYVIDIDENEEPVIKDKKGQLIPNPSKAGSFYKPTELLQQEIIKAKLFPLNPDSGKVIPKINTFGLQNNQQQNQGQPTKKIATRL